MILNLLSVKIMARELETAEKYEKYIYILFSLIKVH